MVAPNLLCQSLPVDVFQFEVAEGERSEFLAEVAGDSDFTGKYSKAAWATHSKWVHRAGG